LNLKGSLYGVGVGPGDPELLTLKAVKIINNSKVIAVPDSGGETSTALEIASAAADLAGKELLRLRMPMTKDARALSACHDAAAREVILKLDNGNDVAFLTLGDPTVYSTYMYIHRRVEEAGYETHITAGVPSFCAAAARLNASLCEGPQALHIIPAAYDDESWPMLTGTKVLMKPGKEFAAVREQLKKHGLLDKAVMVERCGMEGERVYKNLSDTNEIGSYYSIIIVKE
jgi:precorrin-2/cobalt-factor-2 C20-methyltransferase